MLYMSDNDPKGFLHISDLLKIQKIEHIFTIPDEPDDIEKQMNDQIKDEKGVAFDIRLGDQYYLSGEEYTDSSKKSAGIHIQPGQFALLTTYEIFNMPTKLVAFASMRFGIKAEGLINVSGFQVDPGYQGVFIFSVYNAGPSEINLEYKAKIFTIIFSNSSKPISKKRDEIITEIPFDKWTKLRDKKNLSLIGLDERLTNLEFKMGLVKYVAPIIAAAAAIIGLALWSISN